MSSGPRTRPRAPGCIHRIELAATGFQFCAPEDVLHSTQYNPGYALPGSGAWLRTEEDEWRI